MSEEKYTGIVQWFNKRRGFGFIKVIDPSNDLNDKEFFCHYSNINTENYKTLYPGEYVSFDLIDNEDGRKICINITGINNGPLLIDNEKNTYRVYPKGNLNDNTNNCMTKGNDFNEGVHNTTIYPS